MRSELGLTQAQRGLWEEDRAFPGLTVYNTAECVELRGPLDVELFGEAVSRLLAEVPALHARFVERDGQARQVLGEVPPRPPELRDLQHAPDPEAAALKDARRVLDEPFDLGAGVLYRHTLYLLGPERCWWVFQAHHIALDGYGFTLCLQRLAAHHRALREGRALPGGFAPLAPVIGEDAAYQASPARAGDREALKKLYADIPHTPAPLLELGLRRGHRVSRSLSPALTARLKAHAQARGTGWPNVLFALTASFWAQDRGEGAVFLGVPVMQRLGSVSARVPCMVMNMVPLRLNVTPDATLNSLTRQAHGALEALRPHGRYRYEHLWTDLDGHRLFGPEVNVIPFATPLNFGEGLDAHVHNLASGPVEDLALGFTVQGPDLHFTLDGHPALYDPAQVERLHRRIVAALEEGLEAPDLPLARLWQHPGVPA